mgnify:CR=1 FL=1
MMFVRDNNHVRHSENKVRNTKSNNKKTAGPRNTGPVTRLRQGRCRDALVAGRYQVQDLGGGGGGEKWEKLGKKKKTQNISFGKKEKKRFEKKKNLATKMWCISFY